MIRLDVSPIDCLVSIDTSSLRGEKLDFPFQIHWNDYTIPNKLIEMSQGILTFPVSARMFQPSGEQRLTISVKPLKAENGRRLLGMPVSAIRVFQQTAGQSPIIHSLEKFAADRIIKSGKSLGNKLLGKKQPMAPVVPIWQIRFPETDSPTIEREARNYPGCDQVVISACEINSRHGTGLLIQYLFDNFNQLGTVNSYHCYNGDRVNSKIHHCLPNYDQLTRSEIYDHLLEWFGQNPPRQAYVVPYFRSDFLMAIAMKDLFETKVCLHVMDDNCLYGDIPHRIVQEAIEKSDLVFVISPEMRQHYEQQFGRKAYILPPIVPEALLPPKVVHFDQGETNSVPVNSLSTQPTLIGRLRQWMPRPFRGSTSHDRARGILVGNIWDNAWLELLRKTIRDSGLKVDWYSNNPNAVWLQGSEQELADDGIFIHDSLWGQDLVTELRRRPFAIMPSGLLTGEGNKESIARLSLPSRIPFVLATANLPVITLGSPQTAAARFIHRFELGKNIGYDGQQLRAAVREITQPTQQQRIRQQAFELGKRFSAAAMQPWLWNSLDQRKPADNRFEELFQGTKGDNTWYLNTDPPPEVHWSFRDTWKLLNRVRHQGLTPEVIIDVGSSSGNWSWTASTIFPESHYVMIDPMMSRYGTAEREHYLKQIKRFELVEVALSDQNGEAEILVSDDLYGTSLLKVDQQTRSVQVAKVPLMTLDQLARDRRIQGRTLLKIDVQFAEHLVVQGGLNFIQNHVDVMILELTIQREHPQAKTYREMLDMIEGLGFTMVDEMEGWRNPVTGILEQKDTVFVRNELLAHRLSVQNKAA
jgi:FkbM family methyltransferase